MTPPAVSTVADKPLIACLAIVLGAYMLAAGFGLPQKGTEVVVRAAAGEHSAAASHGEASPQEASPPAVGHPPYWMALPFALLLGAIAVFPLIPSLLHWWENNLHRFYIAGGLAALTLLYYLCVHSTPIHADWPAAHLAMPAPTGLNLGQTAEVLANAILSEFVPFIVLLFSLYTICGGIRIAGDLPAHPLTNTALLAAAALLASLIGTTGAAMLLIRPLLETNSRAQARDAHGSLLYLHRVQLRGMLVAAGRPAAVSRLSQGRVLPLDHRVVEGMAVRQREFAGDLLRLGSLVVLPAGEGGRCRPRRNPRTPAAVWRTVAQRRPAGGSGPLGGLARPEQAGAGHRLASLALPARGRAIVACGLVAAAGQQPPPAYEPLQLRGHHRGGRAVLRHLRLHAAAAANAGHRGAQPWPDSAVAVFLGHRRPFLRPRQRPDLRGIL